MKPRYKLSNVNDQEMAKIPFDNAKGLVNGPYMKYTV